MNVQKILEAFSNKKYTDNGYKGIIIAGATATGKSSLADSLAERISSQLIDSTNKNSTTIDSMIINADSIQFYQALQQLTAQPDNLHNHYLYNFLHPAIEYNSTKWLKDLKIILDANPDSIPIIVGGTGMYIDALINGVAELPSRSKNNPWTTRSFEECSQALEKIDPKALQTLKDKRRMERFLDIYDQTGITYTQIQNTPKTQTIQENWLKVYVSKDDNKDLIMKRLTENFDSYIQEVKTQQNLVDGTKLETAIGYREIKNLLNSSFPQNTIQQNSFKNQETIEKIFHKTCQYAKRQRTWFKKYYQADIII